MVGAVLLAAGEHGEVIGEGFHAAYGGIHAERAALEDCRRRGNDPAGATICVSLEPCAHEGRQPPCSQALIAAGIRRVVIASDDPSAKTAGIGPEQMRQAGIEVLFTEGEIAERAGLLNQPFRKHALTGMPLVILKAAISLDGRVATESGDSRWISSELSRALVHQWRVECDAIAVGSGTVATDDPLLTARPANAPPASRQPLRVIFDSTAKLPLGSQLLGSLDVSPVLVMIGPAAPADRVDALRAAGADLFATGLSHDREALAQLGEARVELTPALEELGARGVTSLLLEGGPRLAGAMVSAGLVDELRLFIAPLLFGSGPSLIETPGPERVESAPRAIWTSSERVGEDHLIQARLATW